jgi:nucleoside-diphosphate-sugar epimerase
VHQNAAQEEIMKTALILGATGGIGGALTKRLLAGGWQVKALHRRAAAQAPHPGLQWLQGDAMQRDDVVAAAQGVSLIVHAVNPPGYRNWAQLVLPMIDNTIAAARATSAQIVLPGTLYNFAPDAGGGGPIAENAPQRPHTRKGAIRVELERRLERAAAEHGVRVLIVRAGDFFGARDANNWFSQGLIKPGQPVRAISNPATPGVGHHWAYLPDVAETVFRLVEQAGEMPLFARYHMAGHWDANGTQMAAAIARVVHAHTGRTPAMQRAPWWLFSALSPFVNLFRELHEMRYLWQREVRMDNSALLAALGSAEPHTALDDAVRDTLRALACLPGSAAPRPSSLTA